MNTHTETVPAGAARRLERSSSDRMLAGVAGGLARYFDIHPAVYRVGFVVLTLLGGAGIVIYVAAALVMPKEGEEDSFATSVLKQRRDRPWPLIGLGLLAVAGVALLSRATLWPHGDVWVVLLVLGAAILWITRHGTGTAGEAGAAGTPADAITLAARDSRRVGRLFKGIAIAFATFVALILIALAVFAATFHVHLGNGIGSRSYVVSEKQDLRSSYKLGIGDMKLDLSQVALPAGETHVKARVDVGSLRIVVPAGVAVRVNGSAQAGSVQVLGRTDDGRHAKVVVDRNGARVLVLDTHVGAGLVRVTRAGGR